MRHRPRYPLWVGPDRPPILTCTCHFGTPVTLDRQLPDRAPVRAEQRSAA